MAKEGAEEEEESYWGVALVTATAARIQMTPRRIAVAVPVVVETITQEAPPHHHPAAYWSNTIIIFINNNYSNNNIIISIHLFIVDQRRLLPV